MSHERVETEYGAKTTAKEVVAGIDLSGKSAIVTGGGSGIGIETARALAGAGAAVTLAVRDVEAAESVAQDIRATESTDDVHVAALDLTDLGSIDAFVSDWHGPLEILVNNAGVMHTPEERTKYGWELQFATNHMGHFALTTGLKDASSPRRALASFPSRPARTNRRRSSSKTSCSRPASTTHARRTDRPRRRTSCSPSS